MSMPLGSRFKGNGNKFKGNNAKKGNKGRKSVYADFDPKENQYARVLSVEGGKRLNVQLLNGHDTKPVTAMIRGIHHKRVWFKKDDIVIVTGMGNLLEVDGKANESDVNRIRTKFEKINGSDTGNIIFHDESDDSDSENVQPHSTNLTGACAARVKKSQDPQGASLPNGDIGGEIKGGIAELNIDDI